MFLSYFVITMSTISVNVQSSEDPTQANNSYLLFNSFLFKKEKANANDVNRIYCCCIIKVCKCRLIVQCHQHFADVQIKKEHVHPEGSEDHKKKAAVLDFRQEIKNTILRNPLI